MIRSKPPNPYFNLSFLNQLCFKIVVVDSAVLPYIIIQTLDCKSYINKNINKMTCPCQKYYFNSVLRW